MNISQNKSVPGIIRWYDQGIYILKSLPAAGDMKNPTTEQDADGAPETNNRPILARIDGAPLDTDGSLLAPILPYLSSMEGMADRLKAGRFEVKDKTRIRRNEAVTRDQLLLELQRDSRKFRQNLVYRQKALGAPMGDLVFADLDQPLPKSGSRDWYHVAVEMVETDARLVDLGYEPLASPSASELRDLITKFEHADSQVRKADMGQMKARKELQSTHEESQLLRRRIAAHLRFYYGELPGAERRTIMRALGYLFTPGVKVDVGTASPEPGNEGASPTNDEGSTTPES